MTILLAFCIIPFSLASTITSAISEAIRKDIETANDLAVKLGDEVRSIRAQDETAKKAAAQRGWPFVTSKNLLHSCVQLTLVAGS